MAERTAVYRLYAADGTLLYVGISVNPDRRFEQHARVQPWWPEVARREVVAWFLKRKDAIKAEAAAIISEHPCYNIHIPAPDGRFGMSTKLSGRPATGRDPIRNFRAAAELWLAAQQKAQAEGRTMTDVLLAYLRRYVSTPPRKRDTGE